MATRLRQETYSSPFPLAPGKASTDSPARPRRSVCPAMWMTAASRACVWSASSVALLPPSDDGVAVQAGDLFAAPRRPAAGPRSPPLSGGKGDGGDGLELTLAGLGMERAGARRDRHRQPFDQVPLFARIPQPGERDAFQHRVRHDDQLLRLRDGGLAGTDQPVVQASRRHRRRRLRPSKRAPRAATEVTALRATWTESAVMQNASSSSGRTTSSRTAVRLPANRACNSSALMAARTVVLGHDVGARALRVTERSGDVAAVERQAHAEAKDLGAGIEHAAAEHAAGEMDAMALHLRDSGVDVAQRGIDVSVAQLRPRAEEPRLGEEQRPFDRLIAVDGARQRRAIRGCGADGQAGVGKGPGAQCRIRESAGRPFRVGGLGQSQWRRRRG